MVDIIEIFNELARPVIDRYSNKERVPGGFSLTGTQKRLAELQGHLDNIDKDLVDIINSITREHNITVTPELKTSLEKAAMAVVLQIRNTYLPGNN